MSFDDLARRRTTVLSGGHRVVVRPPSLVTVWNFLRVFGDALGAVIDAAKSDPSIIPESENDANNAIAAVLTARPEQAWKVLRTCVEFETPEPLRIKRDRQLIRSIADSALVGFQPLRLAREINGGSGGRTYRSTKADGFTMLVAALAERLHLDPVAIANDWPAVAVLSLIDAMNSIRDTTDARPLTPSTAAGLSGIGGRVVKKREPPN